MCAKKAKLINEVKERIQESHTATMEKLDAAIQLMSMTKVKSNAISR